MLDQLITCSVLVQDFESGLACRMN